MTAESVIWHDVECSSYVEDLALWEELGATPVLDIGAGTGRVALHLARAGHAVSALDSDPDLLAALSARAGEEALDVQTTLSDARSFDLGRTFASAIAPMQVVQLLGGSEGRGRMLGATRRHLDPGGTLSVALADPFEGTPPDHYLPPLPDVVEQDGYVFQSTPVAVHARPDGADIERLRERVAPDGTLVRTANTICLDLVSAAELEAEAAAAGFRARGRREVPPTTDYVGSTVVVLETA